MDVAGPAGDGETAVGLEAWAWCPRCAGPLAHGHDGGARHVRCARCGFERWDNPLPTTLALIVRGDALLLVRRAHAPRAGWWDAVGGFVDGAETAEACVRREVREELGVPLVALAILGTYASVYGEDGRRTLGVAFVCGIDPAARITLSDEHTGWDWFGLDRLPPLAFADVRDAAADLRRRLAAAGGGAGPGVF